MKSKKHIQMAFAAMKKQAGMTLMEIIAALAIIAAVVVGALALFNSAQSSNTSVTMLKDLIAIRSAVQQIYLGQGGYATTGNINTQLNQARKVPSDLVWQAGTSNYRTPWGGNLTVAPTAAPSPNFTITLTAVPPEVCVQLVTNASTGWSLTTAGGTTIGSSAAGAANPYPVTPALAQTNCATAGTALVFTTIN